MAEPAPPPPSPLAQELPSSPVGPAPSSSPPPSAKKSNRLPIYGGVAAAVIVVVLVLLLVVYPGVLAGPSSNTGPIPYTTAKPIADNEMSGYPNGSWALLVAGGITSPVAVTIPTDFTERSSSNCTFTANSAAPTNISVPAFTGNLTSGKSATWEFLYRNAAGALALTGVLNGQATVFGTLSGSVCSSIFEVFTPIPSDVIDSSQATAAVASDAQAFLSTHTGVTSTVGIIGGISFLTINRGPLWEVAYSTCPVPGVAGATTGEKFNATVDAVTGAVNFFQTRSNVACAT